MLLVISGKDVVDDALSSSADLFLQESHVSGCAVLPLVDHNAAAVPSSWVYLFATAFKMRRLMAILLFIDLDPDVGNDLKDGLLSQVKRRSRSLELSVE